MSAGFSSDGLAGSTGGAAGGVCRRQLQKLKAARTAKRMARGGAAAAANAGAVAATSSATRRKTIAEATRIMKAARTVAEGVSRLRRDRLTVVAVLDTSPPRMPLARAPTRGPPNLSAV